MSKTAHGIAHVVVLLGVLAALAIAGLFVISGGKTGTLEPVAQSVSNLLSLPSPTPFPFQSLTIPGLRGRSYESSLGPLERVSENSDFSSYVTSYISDGLKIYGLLTIPKRETPDGSWPAIVFVHGYIPPEEYRTGENYLSYVNYLARNGYVVFKIDLRGHDRSEGEPGGAYYSEEYVVDTLNARGALASSEFVNAGKIGLWGHSMAGNIVFRSFVVASEVPAMVIWAGAGYSYWDLQNYMIQDDSYRPPQPDSERARKRQALREAHGEFSEDSAFWRQVVPTNYLDGVAGAIQLNHAVNDNVVSIEYSRNLMKILDGTKIIHELKEYPDGGHNINGGSFTPAMQNTVEFFDKYLK